MKGWAKKMNKITKKKWFDMGDGFEVMVNLSYDKTTKEILNEECVCYYKEQQG